MKRLSLVIAAAAAATAVIVLMAASGSAQDPGVQTIQLIEGEGDFRFVDNPPRSRVRRGEPSPSTGDMFAFSAPLTDPQGQRVGRFHAECVITRGARTFERSASQCEGTYRLANGTIALSALLEGDPDPVTFAVTGGTGAYEGRRGSGTSKSRPGRSELSDATIRLLP